ncbi:MAG: hypothetical protein PVI94_20100 [Desulfobacterales bacterium]|jgi:hypothetical protein
MMKDKEFKIGQLLLESLTREQMARMLDVVASAGGLKSYMDDFKKADPDMAATVDKILKGDSAATDGKTASPMASHKRTLEYWDSLWRQWHGIVAELGDGDGTYAVQDHHWEEPYFDGYGFASDLEPIAGDMLSLIDDVYNSVDDPDLFEAAIEDIEENIASYPEWMGAEYGDPTGLEKNVTLCVLNWLWTGFQHELHPGIVLLEKVIDIEEIYKLVYLDPDACIEFFRELPPDACREVYAHLQEDSQAIDLSNVYSPWHQINHIYESRFDATKYLDTCRQHLVQNWRYGRPLVDDAVDRKDYQEAESWLEKTFASLLARKKQVKWYPEVSLLIGQHQYSMAKGREDIANLLQIWGKVSLKLDNLQRGAAAQLQSVIFRLPTDCEAIIKEYKRLINPKIKKSINPLFEQWKTEMAERSFSRYMDAPRASDSWLHWLIEASLDSKTKKEWFMRQLNGWLRELKKDKKTFKKYWPWLARLTSDLPNSKMLKQKYPVFCETALPEEASPDDPLANFRCSSLKKMKAGAGLAVAVDVWKEHLHLIVPDPANVYKSDYSHHAAWCKAVHELNQKTYQALISRWRKTHNRRRNL